MVPDAKAGTFHFPDPVQIVKGIVAVAFLIALYLISLRNYLLFHGIIEVVTIAIAFSIFILVWNNRRIITDAFFLILGIAFLFSGIIDLIHTLAYMGMGVFPGSTEDLPTQLWIAGRYFQSITILIATLFIGRSITKDQRYDVAIIVAACTAACGLLLASIFVWQDFPHCFIEGIGLTPFKIVSEYIISLILIATAAVLYIKRRSFDPEVWRFLIAAQIFLVFGELAFTTYESVYGFTNMLGHLFKFVSFYFFYRAIVVVGLTRPYDLLFRELVENINDVIFTMDMQGKITYISPAISRLFGYDPDIVTGQDFIRFVHPDNQPRFNEWFRGRKSGERGENEFRILTRDGRERYVRASTCPIVRDGRAGGFTCTLTDITDRRKAETELARVNRALRMLSGSNQALIRITDETMLMNEVCRIAVDVGGYRLAWIGFAEQDEAKTVRPVARAGFEPGYIESARVSWADSERGRGPGGTAIRTGQPSMARNIPVDPAFVPWRAEAMLRGYQSVIALPLTSEGRTFGVLGIYASEADAFDTKEVEILKELGDDLAFGITALRTRARRVQVEEALRESERKYRTLAEAALDPIFIIGKDDTVLYVNTRAAQLLNRSTGQILGKPRKSLFPPDIADDQTSDLQTIFNTGKPLRKEARILYGDREFWQDNSLVPLKDENGNVTAVLGISHDITWRKAAEEKLKESEERFRNIFTHAAEGILIADISTQKFLYANPAICTMLGYSAQELTSMGMRDIHPEKDLAHVQDEFMAQARGEKTLAESIPVLRKDGAVLYTDIRTSPVIIDGHRCNVGMFTDITERKRAEESIRKSGREWQTTFDAITDAVFLLDDKGRIIRHNRALELFTGKPADEIDGRYCYDVMHGTSSPFDGCPNVKAQKSRQRESIELKIGNRWVIIAVDPIISEDGTFSGAVHLLIDITERKRSEEALKESEARLNSIIHGSPVLQFVIDRNHRVISWNHALEQYSGIRASDVIGTTKQWQAFYDHERPVIADLLVDEAIDQLPRWYQNKFRKSGIVEGAYEATDFFPRMGASGKWLFFTAAAIRNENGSIIGAVETLEDITDRKRAEEELRKSHDELEQRVRDRTLELSDINEKLLMEITERNRAEKLVTQSLREKETLLKEIHHRVKNNLQIIASLLNLQSRYTKDEATLAVIRDSQTRVKAMALVHEKLYRSADISTIDIDDYIRFLGTSLFEFFGVRITGIAFRTEIRDISVDINTAIPLGLMMNELISNSLKHAFPEGRRGEIFVSVKRTDHTLTILYKDTGAGIPQDFDWRNAKSLGLRLVISLVEQLQGTIELDRVGGTAFTIIVREKE